MSLISKFLGDYHVNQDAQQMVVHCILKHCQSKRIDPNHFVAQTSNLNLITELVHNEIPWIARKLIDRSEIQSVIVQNMQYIRQHIYDASH